MSSDNERLSDEAVKALESGDAIILINEGDLKKDSVKAICVACDGSRKIHDDAKCICLRCMKLRVEGDAKASDSEKEETSRNRKNRLARERRARNKKEQEGAKKAEGEKKDETKQRNEGAKSDSKESGEGTFDLDAALRKTREKGEKGSWEEDIEEQLVFEDFDDEPTLNPTPSGALAEQQDAGTVVAVTDSNDYHPERMANRRTPAQTRFWIIAVGIFLAGWCLYLGSLLGFSMDTTDRVVIVHSKRTKLYAEDYFLVQDKWIKDLPNGDILVSLYCEERSRHDRVVFSCRTSGRNKEKVSALKWITTRVPHLFEHTGTELLDGATYVRFVMENPKFTFNW